MVSQFTPIQELSGDTILFDATDDEAGLRQGLATLALPNGEFFIAWGDSSNIWDQDAGEDIIGALISESDLYRDNFTQNPAFLIGDQVQLNDPFQQNEESQPSLAVLDDTRYVVTYREVTATDNAIRYAIYDFQTGLLQSSGTVVSSQNLTLQYSDPQVVGLGTNDFAVSYTQDNGGDSDVFVSRVLNGTVTYTQELNSTADAVASDATSNPANNNLYTTYEQNGETFIGFVSTFNNATSPTSLSIVDGVDPRLDFIASSQGDDNGVLFKDRLVIVAVDDGTAAASATGGDRPDHPRCPGPRDGGQAAYRTGDGELAAQRTGCHKNRVRSAA